MNWVRLILLILGCSCFFTGQATAQDRYASLIVDADGLDVLHARQIDETRYPASLTKIMTLYLTFEAIEAGHLRLDQSVTVSAHAASTPPVRLGLVRGQSVRIDTLIQAVAVRSSNDAAMVLAEAIDGGERQFVDRMNMKTKSLGMRRTVFQNPHGLPDPNQTTTARDMAKLALATLTHFPQYYHYFGQTEFRGLENTNKLLQDRRDVDGFKTGYTAASGYNLVIRAARSDAQIIVVVLGGASSRARNRHVSDLIDRGFEVIANKRQKLIAARSETAQPVGSKHWAIQIDGFESEAATAIHADQLIRTVGFGQTVARSRLSNGQALHSIRVEQLDRVSASRLCSDHAEILNIPSRRCMVLSLSNPG